MHSLLKDMQICTLMRDLLIDGNNTKSKRLIIQNSGEWLSGWGGKAGREVEELGKGALVGAG